MIEIKNITKSYDEVLSLCDVSATIGSGSIYGLIGSNGAGKSTLLRVMAGIFKPDSGEILFDGRPVFENNAVKKEIFYISDDEYKLPGANTDDMMRFYRSIYDRFDSRRYENLCEMFRVERKRSLSTFSKGMKRQVDILLGLSCRPRYLLCDETFDGLDPVMRQFAKKLICEEVAESGMTPIIASHNLRELEDLCDPCRAYPPRRHTFRERHRRYEVRHFKGSDGSDRLRHRCDELRSAALSGFPSRGQRDNAHRKRKRRGNRGKGALALTEIL